MKAYRQNACHHTLRALSLTRNMTMPSINLHAWRQPRKTTLPLMFALYGALPNQRRALLASFSGSKGEVASQLMHPGATACFAWCAICSKVVPSVRLCCVGVVGGVSPYAGVQAAKKALTGKKTMACRVSSALQRHYHLKGDIESAERIRERFEMRWQKLIVETTLWRPADSFQVT